MADPTFGFSINTPAATSRAVAGADMSVVAVVGTAPDADAERFPYDVPVVVFSDDPTLADDLGAAGTLLDAVAGVNDQLGELQRAARIVIVRSEIAMVEGEPSVTGTIANMVAANRGIHALKLAPTLLGITPRLVMVPGYTHQRAGPAANAVCAALGGVLDQLLAVAVVDGPNTSSADDKAWRATLAHKRLIAVTGGVTVLAGNPAEATAAPLSPRAIGIAVAVDHENGGRPFRSWANRPVKGILGPARPIAFSLTDGAVDGQDLLASQIGVIVRGEPGVDDAIGDGGFVLVAIENAGEDEVWRQYHQVRGRDFIHLYFLRALRFYLGKFNLTGHLLTVVQRVVKSELIRAQSLGEILGFAVEYRPDQNQPEQLALGNVAVRVAFEEAPLFRRLTIRSERYREALDDLLESLVNQAQA